MSQEKAFGQARAHYQAGRLDQAEQACQQILYDDPQHADACHLAGLVAHRGSKHEAGIENIQRAIELNPHNAAYHSNLGEIYRSLGAIAESVACCKRALEIMPDYVGAHYNLGNALYAQGNFVEAVVSYQQALRIRPDLADAYHNLGNALHNLQRYAEAATSYHHALRIRPSFAGAHYNLGNTLHGLGRLEAAVASYRQAIDIEPEFAKAHGNLGDTLTALGKLAEAVVHYRSTLQIEPDFPAVLNKLDLTLRTLGKLDEAVACYERALQIQPDYPEAHNNLANALKDQGSYEEALARYQRALDVDPDFIDAHNNLGLALEELGKLEEAASSYREAQRIRPDQLLSDVRIARLCPTIYESNEQIDEYRRRLLSDLKRLGERGLRVEIAELSFSGCQPPFNLQFHARNDRPIKEAYAAIFGDCFPAETPPTSEGRPRVGFVVTRGHERGFLKSMVGILQHMNRDLFEQVVICTPTAATKVRAALKNEHTRILTIPDRLDRVVERIRAVRFDILYYWEVATDPINYFLPFFRLAPVQCNSWGIQVTSGIPQMDYYLSSKDVEPEDADEHYSENLIRANSLLAYQYRETLPDSPKSRGYFGFSDDQHLYACAQHLGKFHPDFDVILASILRRDDQGIVAVTEDRFGHDAVQLRSRFANIMPDVADRIVFLRRLGESDYLSLLAAADVLLDPLHFGGVYSTYDGLSLGKPIVTLPQNSQRAKYTAACYQTMGVTECVANNVEDYVDIAIRLATDGDQRAAVEKKIEEASPLLFENMVAVREHERILQTLLDEARRSSQ